MKNLFKNIQKIQKQTVWALILLNVALAGGYIYAVNQTVFNVVTTTNAKKALAQSSAVTADLESRQVSLKNSITLDFAYAQGFQDASNKQIFIVKKPASNTLSFNAL